MQKYRIHVLLIAALIITIVGLITGKFIFLVLFLPLGWLFSRKKNQGDRPD